MTGSGSEWSDAEFRELQAVFFSQAREIVADLQDLLLTLEAEPGNAETLRSIKRHLHTLKGDSHAMGLTATGMLCHRAEDILSPGPGQDGIEGEGVELLLQAADRVRLQLDAAEAGRPVPDAEDLIARIGAFLRMSGMDEARPGRSSALSEYQLLQARVAREEGSALFEVVVTLDPRCQERELAVRMVVKQISGAAQVIWTDPDPDSPAAAAADHLRILLATREAVASIERHAAVAGITSEVSVQPYAEERAAAPAEAGDAQPSAQAAPSPRQGLVRVDAGRVDRIMDLVGELIIGRSMMEQTARELEQGLSAADAAARLGSINAYFDRTVSDLKKAVMKLRMVPVNHVFRTFPKMVRDLAAERARSVRLEISGREAELDKGIVDALGEPLAHLIRNMVDHGIEPPAERQAAGKPEQGTISLRAFQEGSRFVIEAADDGRGINAGKVKLRAVEMGLLDALTADALGDRDAWDLIFLPGLSTAAVVSDISGRGVGMDAVRAAVEALKGTIEIESAPGRGTLFRIRLPLTLAVIKGLLFSAGERQYAVPVAAVAEVVRIGEGDLTTVDGRSTLLLRDQVISVVDLQALFGASAAGRRKYALVLAAGRGRMGLLIDRLLWQQELVLKAVDPVMVSSPCVAGASILGDGKVVLILDDQALLAKAVRDEKERMVMA